jgi:hypothetical protein
VFSRCGGATIPLGLEMTIPTPQTEHAGNPGLGGRATGARGVGEGVATAAAAVKMNWE